GIRDFHVTGVQTCALPISTHGDVTAVSAHAKAHWEIAGFDRLFDFARGAKVTGAGFPFYVGDAAKIVRALLHFFLDEAGKAGYRSEERRVGREWSFRCWSC